MKQYLAYFLFNHSFPGLAKRRRFSLGGLLISCLVLFLTAPIYGHAADSPKNSFKYNVHVDTRAGHYDYLLRQPSYLAIALENIGINISLSGKWIPLDDHTLQISNVSIGNQANSPALKFLDQEGTRYHYQAGFMGLDFPVSIDISAINDGLVVLAIDTSLASIVPQRLSEIIEERIENLASVNVQNQLLNYLEELARTKPKDWGEKEWINTQILLQGYKNQALGKPRVPGDSMSGINWWMLLTPWLIVFTLIITIINLCLRKDRAFASGIRHKQDF